MRFWQHTIWGKGQIPASEKKYATPLKRFFLPLFDVVMIVGGFYAVTSGIPAFEEQLPEALSDALGYLFAAVAVLCFLGIAIPKWFPLEIAAKILLFSLLGIYWLALRQLADDGSTGRDFISTFVFGCMLVPPLRLWILGIEITDRKVLEEANTAAREALLHEGNETK
jgi:hypothetical protein